MAKKFLTSITISASSGGEYTFPIADGTANQAIITDGDGNLSFGSAIASSAEDAQRLVCEMINASGSTIGAFLPVCCVGMHSDGTPEIAPARADNALYMPAIGVTQASVGNNNRTDVLLYGKIENVNTTAYQTGDTLYVAPTGGWTTTRPTGTNYIQAVLKVGRVHANNGSGGAFGAGKYEDLPNLGTGKIWVGDSSSYPVATEITAAVNTAYGYTPANDSAVVHIADNETITGDKTFSSSANIKILQIKEGGGFANLSGYTQLAANSTYFHFNNGANTAYARFLYASGQRAYTLPSSDGTIALTSQLSAYLPLSGGTLAGALVINPANYSTVGLDVASNTIRFRTDSAEPFNRQLTTTIGSGTLVKMQAAGYGATYVTDLGFYTSSGSAVNTTPNLYLTGGDNRVGINTDTPAYTLDVAGTIGASGAITANSFVKASGTSAQFLMADGSVSLGATAAARTEQIFTATSGQTTFTVTGGYVVGLVDVYVNGVKLLPSDFTATNGSTVVLATGAVLNDSVTIINYTATIAALPTSRDTIDYTATSAQTTFTVSGGYAVGLLDVYVNGVKLTSSEYTATNGTTFVLAVASVTGDQVQAIRYNASITGVSGSGTANYIPKFTASGTLGNSLIQDDGTNVIIGSTDSNLLLPRAAVTNNATVNFATGGTTKWNVGLRGLYSADDFYIFNPVLGINYITLSAASSLANFGVSIRAQTFTSYIASGIFLNNSSGGTSAVQMRINNTGGDFRAGIESSAGGTIQTGTSAYAAVFGNQANYATQFTTNGTIRMTIDNAGLVGIGTTSPNGKLTSYGNEIGLQLTFTKDAPSGAYGRLGQDSNGTFLTQNAKYDGSSWTRDNTGGVPMALALHNGNGRYEFRIAPNGANPISWTNALVIESTGAATFSSSVTAQANGSTFGTASASGRGLIVQSGSSDAAIQLKNAAGGDGTIFATGTSTTMNYSFSTYSTANALFISNGGNVGIGTTSPTDYSGYNTLHINGKSGSNGGVLRLTSFDSSSSVNIYAGGSAINFNTTSAVPFVFLTQDTERMRITNGGNVLIQGTSDNGFALQIYGSAYSNKYRLNDGGGGYVTLEMENSARWRINYLGRFSGYGAGTLTTDSSGNISASSDRSLKDIIRPVENVLENIMDFEPVYFKWNDKTDLDKENVYMSTIAQSIQKHYPDAVGKMADGTLTVQDRAVTAILVKAIQELKAELDTLKNA